MNESLAIVPYPGSSIGLGAPQGNGTADSETTGNSTSSSLILPGPTDAQRRCKPDGSTSGSPLPISGARGRPGSRPRCSRAAAASPHHSWARAARRCHLSRHLLRCLLHSRTTRPQGVSRLPTSADGSTIYADHLHYTSPLYKRKITAILTTTLLYSQNVLRVLPYCAIAFVSDQPYLHEHPGTVSVANAAESYYELNHAERPIATCAASRCPCVRQARHTSLCLFMRRKGES